MLFSGYKSSIALKLICWQKLNKGSWRNQRFSLVQRTIKSSYNMGIVSLEIHSRGWSSCCICLFRFFDPAAPSSASSHMHFTVVYAIWWIPMATARQRWTFIYLFIYLFIFTLDSNVQNASRSCQTMPHWRLSSEFQRGENRFKTRHYVTLRVFLRHTFLLPVEIRYTCLTEACVCLANFCAIMTS